MAIATQPTVKIDTFTPNGYGLGTLNGLKVFVIGSVPGDIVTIKIKKKKNDMPLQQSQISLQLPHYEKQHRVLIFQSVAVAKSLILTTPNNSH